MACFLNMRHKIGTVCLHSIFWSKEIQDEYKLLKRISHFRYISIDLRQDMGWEGWCNNLNLGTLCKADKLRVCQIASSVHPEEGSAYFFLLKQLDRLSLRTVPAVPTRLVAQRHPTTCLLPC